MVGADVVLGLSAKGAITKEMVASMAPNPIIFAMANPDPEITPEDVPVGALRRHHRHRPVATMSTRSTTSWASPTSSAARWTCAPGRSITR